MPNGLAKTQKDIDMRIYLVLMVLSGNAIIATGERVSLAIANACL